MNLKLQELLQDPVARLGELPSGINEKTLAGIFREALTPLQSAKAFNSKDALGALASLMKALNRKEIFMEIDSILREDLADYFHEIGDMLGVNEEQVEDIIDDREW